MPKQKPSRSARRAAASDLRRQTANAPKRKKKIKIPRQGQREWPAELRGTVKGYKRPDSGKAGSVALPQLSAGMPGNEEVDP